VPAVVLGGVATIGVVSVCAVVFPAMRTIDRFTDVRRHLPPLEAGGTAEVAPT